MRACKDIDFLDSYWKEAKRIADDVVETLPTSIGEKRDPVYESGGTKMFIVKFSDLKDSWDVSTLVYTAEGKSKKLEALADKISTMIRKGRADSVKPMVKAICNNNVKKLTQPFYDDGEHLGYGHFRWNYQAYRLNDKEIDRVKEYFKL
jgi:hypothetical protein